MNARRPALAAALAALAAAACTSPEGTIVLSITAAPGSDVMERIERVRLSLSDPPAVAEAERGPDGGFDLALDVVAKGERGRLLFEGFDAGGELVAVGHAGPLPIAAITVGVEIYVAPPDSLAEAPVRLEPARTEIGAAPLVYGAILVGGRDASGEVLDEALIYNVHRHAFQLGAPLPAPRAGAALAARQPAGPVYIFGGLDEADEPTRTGWSFDTQTPPGGVYTELAVETGSARAGAAAASLGDVAYFITGDPPLELDPFTSTVRRLGDAPPLAGTATATRAGDEPIVFITGADPDEPRAARWRDLGLELLDAPPELGRRLHAAVALPHGDVLVIGGAPAGDGAPLASAVLYRAAAGTFEVLDEFLATGRAAAAVASARGRLLVAGGYGEGGAVLADAELFDAETLEPLGTLELVVPRAEAVAVALENGQLLIAGGVDADGAPVGILELFTGR
jgi:hypothetical protein